MNFHFKSFDIPQLNAGVEEQMYRDLVTKYTTVGDTNNEYVTMWNKLQSQVMHSVVKKSHITEIMLLLILSRTRYCAWTEFY